MKPSLRPGLRHRHPVRDRTRWQSPWPKWPATGPQPSAPRSGAIVADRSRAVSGGGRVCCHAGGVRHRLFGSFFARPCIETVNPQLDRATEQTIGTHSAVSHEAPTPVGLEVTPDVELMEGDGRLVFAVTAHDGIDCISRGRQERFVIHREKFDAKVGAKRARA